MARNITAQEGRLYFAKVYKGKRYAGAFRMDDTPENRAKAELIAEKIKINSCEFEFTLTKGDTKETLKLREADFAFLDGGHSEATVRWDYEQCCQVPVVVFDDADAIFFDDVSLNLLKAVCDTTERRRVSWLSEGKLIDDETAVMIPRSFDFEGTIIFISNYDFDAMIDRGHKLAPHLEALMSRAMYIDLGMKNKRDYFIRIKQVIADGMLNSFTAEQQNDILSFIEENIDSLHELSLRMALKIADLVKISTNWRNMARATCMR